MKRIYLVTDFGAVANANELQTDKIQNAIDKAFLDGGGEVVIPKGVFNTATIRMRSNVTLHLLSGAVLSGSTNHLDYTHFLDDKIEPINPQEEVDEEYGVGTFVLKRWYDALIKAYKAENIKIIGDKDSYIVGNNTFNPDGEEGYRGPHAIQMTYCKNVELCGYTIKDSANWAHTIYKSQNIFAHQLTVLGGHDGFHVRVCKNVLIENSEFYTGDDCIAGFANENVVIKNCMLDCACSALRFGGSDVLVDNCKTHAPSRYGFRGSLSLEEKKASAPTHEGCRHTQHTPFLYFCDFPVKVDKPQGNIVIQNCEFDSPNSFFRLRWGRQWCKNLSLSDITFKNCKCRNVTMPIELFSDVNEPCTFRLVDVEISPKKGYENIAFMVADSFKQIYFDNVTLTNFNNPTIYTKTDGEITIKDSSNVFIQNVDDLDKYL